MSLSATNTSNNRKSHKADRQSIESAAWFAVIRAYEECDQLFAAMLAEMELTTSQFDVLIAVDRLGANALPKEVAKQLLVTRANVSGLLRRLEQRGLLGMQPHKTDGRSLVCRLTPTGKKALRRAKSASSRFLREQLSIFSDADLNGIQKKMQRMREHLSTMNPIAISKAQSNHAR